jgi:DNA-binding transcriptional LysR family regulator
MVLAMDLAALSLFADIARRGSFAAVARERAIEPSTVSRSLAALEAELGFRLFQRSTRKVALTEAGSAYLRRIEDLLAGLDAAREEAHAVVAGPSGALRITASVAFGARMIVPLLAEFRGRYPGVRLELIFTDDNVDLVAERIDIAFRLAPSYRGDVVGVRVLETRYRVCATPRYLASVPPLNSPRDLAAHRCLLFALPQYRSRWLFRQRGGKVEEVPVDGDIVISNALALFTAMLQGLGPALLPDWLIHREFADRRVVDVFPTFEAAATDFSTAAWLLYPSRSQLPPKTRAAIDFFRARLPAARAQPRRSEKVK